MVKRGGKVPCSKETRKLTRKDSVITFSSWNTPGKIKTDNDLNIRRKQTSSLTPASNHLHTTSSSYPCTSCAGHWMEWTPNLLCIFNIPSALTSILTGPSESHSLRTRLPSLQLPSPTPAWCFVLNWRLVGASSGSELESRVKSLITELCSQRGQVAHHCQTFTFWRVQTSYFPERLSIWAVLLTHD